MSADLDRCVDFLQRLIRTQSLPGHEGDLARVVADEMRALGYPEVRVDEVGNVLARIPGGDAPAVMFNTHLDHVDVGDPDRWPHPPYGAEIHDGRVWGRGAVDIKGPLATQVHGVARLLAAAEPPAGDVWVTGVVQEEVGGFGARHLAQQMQPPIVVVGEPTAGTLRRGHRGRSELLVHIRGRSVHASVPETGVNPFAVLARIVAGLDTLEMPSQEDLGHSTVTPTLVRTDQTSGNVVPGEIWLTLDWRHVPGETGDDAREKVQRLADASLVDGATVEVDLPAVEMQTYTGARGTMRGNNPAYILAADHSAVVAAREIIGEVQDGPPDVGTWRFATDGGHFSAAGMACVGYGPGDEFLAHTVDESVEIDELSTAMDVYEALARSLGRRCLT